MLKFSAGLLLALGSQAAYCDVPDGHHSIAENLLHQLFATHHLPLTLLLIAVVLLARGVRKARKSSR